MELLFATKKDSLVLKLSKILSASPLSMVQRGKWDCFKKVGGLEFSQNSLFRKCE